MKNVVHTIYCSALKANLKVALITKRAMPNHRSSLEKYDKTLQRTSATCTAHIAAKAISTTIYTPAVPANLYFATSE